MFKLYGPLKSTGDKKGKVMDGVFQNLHFNNESIDDFEKLKDHPEVENWHSKQV